MARPGPPMPPLWVRNDLYEALGAGGGPVKWRHRESGSGAAGEAIVGTCPSAAREAVVAERRRRPERRARGGGRSNLRSSTPETEKRLFPVATGGTGKRNRASVGWR